MRNDPVTLLLLHPFSAQDSKKGGSISPSLFPTRRRRRFASFAAKKWIQILIIAAAAAAADAVGESGFRA
jgi:hypothetical protein